MSKECPDQPIIVTKENIVDPETNEITVRVRITNQSPVPVTGPIELLNVVENESITIPEGLDAFEDRSFDFFLSESVQKSPDYKEARTLPSKTTERPKDAYYKVDGELTGLEYFAQQRWMHVFGEDNPSEPKVTGKLVLRNNTQESVLHFPIFNFESKYATDVPSTFFCRKMPPGYGISGAFNAPIPHEISPVNIELEYFINDESFEDPVALKNFIGKKVSLRVNCIITARRDLKKLSYSSPFHFCDDDDGFNTKSTHGDVVVVEGTNEKNEKIELQRVRISELKEGEVWKIERENTFKVNIGDYVINETRLMFSMDEPIIEAHVTPVKGFTKANEGLNSRIMGKSNLQLYPSLMNESEFLLALKWVGIRSEGEILLEDQLDEPVFVGAKKTWRGRYDLEVPTLEKSPPMEAKVIYVVPLELNTRYEGFYHYAGRIFTLTLD